MNKLTRITMTLALALACAQGAFAAQSLTLVGPILGNTYGPQSTSNPCIIAGTQCQQPAGFGFNNFVSNGNISSYNMYSTTPTAAVADSILGTPYTVGQLTAGVTATFNVAIDVNTTSAAGETLQLFEVLDRTNNTVLYSFSGPAPIGNIANNGNGFGDWQLGTISLVGLPSTELILFHAVWTGASDGAESFWLTPANGGGGPLSVPEPETYAMLLAGLGLMGFIVRRRQRKS